ncbi:MAG: cupin domain-containing protein [Limisphaerales bacterium]
MYVVDGEWSFEVGKKQFRLGPGESVFIPRNIPHGWGPVTEESGKVINMFQPAGKMEDFMRAVSKQKDLPTREQALKKEYTEAQVEGLHRLFTAHGIDLLPPLDRE